MNFPSLREPVETELLQIEQRLTQEFRRRSAGSFLGDSFRSRRDCGRSNPELVQDVKSPPSSKRQNARRNFIRTIAPNFRPTLNAKSLPTARKQQSQVIVNFRRRSHIRTRIACGVLLPDGYRRRDPGDLIHIRFFHALQKLPRIRRKRFHVAALPFRINGVESERRFSRAADPRHNSNGVMRDFDADVLEVVDAGAPDADGLLLRSNVRGRVYSLVRRQREAQTARFERTA